LKRAINHQGLIEKTNQTSQANQRCKASNPRSTSMSLAKVQICDGGVSPTTTAAARRGVLRRVFLGNSFGRCNVHPGQHLAVLPSLRLPTAKNIARTTHELLPASTEHRFTNKRSAQLWTTQKSPCGYRVLHH
jgi:hypothetical protein